VRFTVEDEALLRQLYALSGLSMSQIIRRSVHYMVPRFLDGRINLLTLQEESKHPVRLEHPGLQEQQLKPRL
jgi:hypothetical protein